MFPALLRHEAGLAGAAAGATMSILAREPSGGDRHHLHRRRHARIRDGVLQARDGRNRGTLVTASRTGWAAQSTARLIERIEQVLLGMAAR